MAGAEFVGVDLRDGGDQALEERLLGHFEAEDGDRLAGADGDVFGEVEGQRGFSLRGTRGEDEQLGGLKAGGELVELDVAGGDAGDALAFAEDFFEALAIVAVDVFDSEEAAADAVFGEIGSAAGGFKIAAAVEFFGEGDEVDGLLAFAERDHLGEDAAVLVEEEILGLEIFDGGVEGVVVENDGAEDGTLGVEVVGERLFEGGVGWHLVLSIFALVSPPVTRTPSSTQEHPKIFRWRGITLGSTDSLFVAA